MTLPKSHCDIYKDFFDLEMEISEKKKWPFLSEEQKKGNNVLHYAIPNVKHKKWQVLKAL